MTPFVEGYISAIRQSHPELGDAPFSDETLARIMEDCASAANIFEGLGFKTGAVEGRRFWRGRNDGSLTGAFGVAFPPLTLSLNDAGKVVFSQPSNGREG